MTTTAVETTAERIRALVVDDHPFIRTILKNMLVQAGVGSVEEAVDGDDAIAKLQAPDAVFDIIFCDLQMPGRDGIETLRAFAGLGTKASIVLMSGEDVSILAAAENLAKSHGLSVLGHVTKPVSAEQVRRFLAARIQNGSPLAVSMRSDNDKIDEPEIRRGLATNEFFVLFQPKVDLASKTLLGVEVLARWRNLQYGAISPLVFIPIAEQSDVIDQLTEFVLREALAAQAVWRGQGQEVRIAINISTGSMGDLDFPNRLAAIVAELGGTPSSIVLEVTESRLAKDLSAFLETATRLRLKGFHLSIDDFGTGFSTLEQLSRLPVSELKIDRAFVAGTPGNDRTRAILEASLSLARSLNLTSVCEGVETVEEWDLIRKLGADCAQGFYVARPMTSADLIAWCRSWPPHVKTTVRDGRQND